MVVFVCVCDDALVFVYIYICMYVCIYTYIHVYVCVCLCMCGCACVCTCARVCTACPKGARGQPRRLTTAGPPRLPSGQGHQCTCPRSAGSGPHALLGCEHVVGPAGSCREFGTLDRQHVETLLEKEHIYSNLGGDSIWPSRLADT